MKRILIITGLTLIAIVAVAGASLWGLLNTDTGRRIIIAQAETAIADAVGGTAKIGALKGALPGEIILQTIVLSDEGGPWATIETINIALRPFKLLRGQVDIQNLDIISAHLLRKPPEEKRADTEAPLAFSLKLPNNLPDITIDKFSLVNFQSDLGNEPLRLDGAGNLDIGGRDIVANIKITSENNLDDIDAAINLQRNAGQAFLDITIAAAEGGIIATLAAADGPIDLTLKGGGPINAAQFSIDTGIGAYGKLTAKLSGDLERIVSADLAGQFTPGPALGDIEELNLPVIFDLRIDERGRGGVVTINRLTSAIGDITGTAQWKGASGALKNLSLDLHTVFAENYRPDLLNYLGEAATIAANVERKRGAFAVDGSFTSNTLTFAIRKGKTDLRKQFTGEVSAEIGAMEQFSFLNAKAMLTGVIDADLDDKIDVQKLSVTLDHGSSLGGAGFYAFNTQELAFAGALEASPTLISSFGAPIDLTGNTHSEIDITGTLDQFTLTAAIKTPAAKVNNAPAPPLVIDIALAGLPLKPTGQITARAPGGEGQFKAVLRSSEDGRISVPELGYRSETFTLTGSGAYRPEAQAIDIALAYSGQTDAEPWPGLPLAGDFEARGALAMSGEETRFILTSQRLVSETFGLSGLLLTAEGAPDAVSLGATVTRLTTPPTGMVQDFSLAGKLDISDVLAVTLTQISGLVANTRFSLRAPSKIQLKDGVSVENFRLNWGSAGRIALDGAFSPTRWRADIRLSDVNVPGADGVASATIYLDTDEPIPARGALEMRSLLVDNLTDAIKTGFVWNGEAVIVQSAADEAHLDMRISYPALLTKAPALSINTEGALDGYIRYDGPIGPVAAYLPPALQTLEGDLDANFKLSGSTTDPALSGQAKVTDGAYTELRTGLSIIGVHTEATASYGAAGSQFRFSGGARGADQSGDDTITLDGEIALTDEARLDLRINFDNAELSAHPVSQLRASGEVSIAGPLDALAANGAIQIAELSAEIVTPENTGLVPIEVVSHTGEETHSISSSKTTTQAPIDLDFKIDADDRIFIRGRGLESEWSTSITATTEKQAALILGRMKLRRGWLDFSGRRFTLTRGEITFDRLSPNNPLLNIRAEYKTSDGVTAIIAVSGRADEPKITLTANPPSSSNDIMALILFGKPADQLSALESLQAAQALASLGGIGPFGGAGFAGTLRRSTGLDLLNFDLDPEKGGGSLTVGKYVADGLFVTATQDAQGDNGSVRIQYEITDSITVETEVKQDGNQTVSANWKRDF
jgi:translocation and assembly module TamB